MARWSVKGQVPWLLLEGQAMLKELMQHLSRGHHSNCDGQSAGETDASLKVLVVQTNALFKGTRFPSMEPTCLLLSLLSHFIPKLTHLTVTYLFHFCHLWINFIHCSTRILLLCKSFVAEKIAHHSLLKGTMLYLAHSFQVFSPWNAASNERAPWLKGVVLQSCLMCDARKEGRSK